MHGKPINIAAFTVVAMQPIDSGVKSTWTAEVPVHGLLDLYAAGKPAKIRADQKNIYE